MNEHPGRAYRAMKKMGAWPGDWENDGIFNVISNQNENLSLEQSTDRILKYFSSISQEYLPFEISRLPEDMQRKLRQEVNSFDKPVIQPFQVFQKWKISSALQRRTVRPPCPRLSSSSSPPSKAKRPLWSPWRGCPRKLSATRSICSTRLP